MCIICVIPPGKQVKREELKEAFRINDDGAGLMFNHDNKVCVVKGWFAFRKFWKAFKALRHEHPESTFVLHMRIGTSGAKNRDNCHPFQIGASIGFAHNGVMRLLGDKERSDTREFAEDVLCKLPEQWWEQPAIIQAIEKCAITSFSKFVFLFASGGFIILNEKQGNWHDGCWYSNYSYIVLPIVSNGHWDDKQKRWITKEEEMNVWRGLDGI